MSKSKIKKYFISTLVNQEDRIEENLTQLQLNGIVPVYQYFAKEALQNNKTHMDYFESVLQAQISWNENNRITRWMQQARFEIKKTLQEFDFSHPRKIDKRQIAELASCRFVANAEDVVFLGPTGIGKTHLASSLGIEAVHNGFETRFITLRQISDFVEKINDNALDLRKFMIILTRPKLLILDEIALFPASEVVKGFLTKLVLNRYGKSSTIYTSNKSFSAWGSSFGDQHTAAMVIDRIIQRAKVVTIEGESYRMKKKLENND